ncbi:hypothetical protein [Bradyrhizobium sp. STM 3809]|uniref:hypothetical protein n=1 Tax=Bradyrhizobium sp. STM 3809 TaxID=551936 RepID=UPI00024065E7|nr:hypothetical protein [Bradyrhizobium sp. STM 3809]CCD99611.1 conserved exported hypothetical protein [Bradyrhizobium sp. STM 3809]
MSISGVFMERREATWIVLALAVLSSSIRPAVAGLDDFKVAAIEVVDDYDQADISPMGHRPRSLIKVTLSSDVDLRDYARDGFHVGVNVGVCLQGSFTIDQTKDLMGAYVYDTLGNLIEHREIVSPPASEHAYHFYVDVAFRPLFEPAPGQPPPFSWDLRTTPEDICFVIRGAKMLGTGFRTNLVMIPATDIAEAIARRERAKKAAGPKTNDIRDRR